MLTSTALPNSSISIETTDRQMSSISTTGTGNMVQLINIQSDGTPISSKTFVITQGENIEIKDYRAVNEC